MVDLSNLRAFANGDLSEDAFMDIVEADQPLDLENDEKFFQECVAIALPLYLQAQILEEAAGGDLDEAVNETYTRLANYMVGQGIISEATIAVNRHTNVIHMSIEAQKKRLTKIFTLKLARRAKSKNFMKYKMALHLKKINMAAMVKQFGAKAERLMKKAWAALQRQPKVRAETKKAKK